MCLPQHLTGPHTDVCRRVVDAAVNLAESKRKWKLRIISHATNQRGGMQSNERSLWRVTKLKATIFFIYRSRVIVMLKHDV